MFVILFVTFHAVADESNHKSPGGPSVGTLLEDRAKSLPYMCECEFYRGPINGETMVFATRNERAVGFAVVDGRLVTLKRDGKPADTRCWKNTRYHERWVSSAATIVLDQHVTGSGAEACWYKGKLHVTVDGRAVSIPISGTCGC
jgi:hypothetical protein